MLFMKVVLLHFTKVNFTIFKSVLNGVFTWHNQILQTKMDKWNVYQLVGVTWILNTK